jgi:hypothetical protein
MDDYGMLFQGGIRRGVQEFETSLPPQEETTIGTNQFDQVLQICFCALFIVAFWYVLPSFCVV